MRVSQLDTILGVWAHPDDEVFTSGALMAMARTNGQRVIVLTATHGDAGKSADVTRWPQAELTQIRTRECEKALALLGVDEHQWLDYSDGKLDTIDDDEAVERILVLLEDVHPDTIVTFEPEGITGHEDHKAVYRWSRKLSARLPNKPRVLCATECQEFYERYGKKLDELHNVYFNVDEPKVVSKDTADFCVQPEKAVQELKFRAIAAHESQTAGMLSSDEGRAAVQKMCECECFTFAVKSM